MYPPVGRFRRGWVRGRRDFEPVDDVRPGRTRPVKWQWPRQLPWMRRTGVSPCLVFMSFLKQKNVDLCLVGSTNPATTKIFTAGSKRIPTPDDDMPLLWPVDHEAFVAASLVKKKIGGGAFRVLARGNRSKSG